MITYHVDRCTSRANIARMLDWVGTRWHAHQDYEGRKLHRCLVRRLECRAVV